MRLTLRTLLAYRDAVLPRLEHESLHRRIQQNPDAANLLQRINQLIVSQELTPVSLEADGIDSPNVIAGYLDDVLTAPKIAELERLCLQNSGHLRELAQCHQLLAEATRTRVEVPRRLKELAFQLRDPKSRDAVRAQLQDRLTQTLLVDSTRGTNQSTTSGLGNAGQSPASDASTGRSSSDVLVNLQTPMLASGGSSIQPKGLNLDNSSLSREVPEYLLVTRRRRWRLPAAIAALAFLLAGIVWNSLGSLADLQSLWSGETGTVPANKTPPTASSPSSVAKIKSGNANPRSDDVTESGGSAASTAPEELNTTDKPDLRQPKPDAAMSKSDEPLDVQSTTRPASEIEPPTSDSSADKSAGATSEPSAQNTPPTDLPTNAADAAAPPTDTTFETDPSTIHGMRLSPSSNGSPVPFLLAESVDTGLQLLTENHAPLIKSRLIAPPSTRSQIETSSWNMTLAGPSVVELQLEGDRLEVDSVLLQALVSCQQLDQQLLLRASGGIYQIVFKNSSAWLSLEVEHRQVARGSIQETNTYLPVVVMVAGCDDPDANGPLIEITRTETTQSATLEEPGRGVAIVGDGNQAIEEFALLNPPRWYSKRSISVMQQLATDDLMKGLRSGASPLKERLRELSNDDRPEVAVLAIELSLLIGDPEPFANQLLVDDRLRSFWSNTLALARQLLSSHPESITSLRQALQAAYGQQSGSSLMELLLGLSQERLASDALAVLVKGLDSDQLPVRVLSIFELQQLTGQNLGYLPHAPVRSSLQQWRQQLNGGKLKITPIADPIEERTALP